MMNKIKKDQVFSECLQPIFMSILDSLIYNNEYSSIDSERSDCNVGARKNRNIRDNIFVVNAIFNTIKKVMKSVLIQLGLSIEALLNLSKKSFRGFILCNA